MSLCCVGTGVNVARYHRVSTEHQDLRRQAKATEEYVDENHAGDSTVVYNDADTGTDTDRGGYSDLMADVEAGRVDLVVTKDMSRVARSLSDLMRTVERVRDAGCSLVFIDDPIEVHPGDDDPTQELILQILGAVAEFEAKITRQRVREGIAARQDSDEYHHGRPPLGFESDDGLLVETTEYHRICAVLEMVQNLDLSKREAASRLDCARSTIRNALSQPELYGLEG